MQLLQKLNEILNSSFNAKVLMPVQPTFLLELVDLLLHKLNDQVQIVVISHSAHSVVQYANINLEYLNQKLQEKIYLTENPLSFDKLFKQNRLKIYSNIQEYLNSKKTTMPGVGGSKVIPNETCRELFITSHESLRLGEAPYLIQYLNTLKALQKPVQPKPSNAPHVSPVPELSLLLTDPLLGNSSFLDNKLMRPFHPFNKVNVVYLPITSAIGCCDIQRLAHFLQRVAPKRILANKKIEECFRMMENSFQIDGELEVGACVEISSSSGPQAPQDSGSCLLGKMDAGMAEGIRMENLGEAQGES